MTRLEASRSRSSPACRAGPPAPAPTPAGALCAWTRRPASLSARRVCGSTAAASPRAWPPTWWRRCSRSTPASRWTARATCGSAASPAPRGRWQSTTPSAASRCTSSSSPREGSPRAASGAVAGAAATGGFAHHLLDPSTGAPAHTGVVQATALAPSALEAEVRAKAALLAGPETGSRWLRHGGALVLDDGSFEVVDGR